MPTPADRSTVDDPVGARSMPGARVMSGAVVLACAVVGCVLLLLASRLHAVPRVVLGAVGLVGVGIATLAVCALLLFVLGWGLVTGTFRERPSSTQRGVWLLAGALGGLVVGAGTYAVGPMALADGPIIAAAVVAALRIRPFTRDYVNGRLHSLAAVGAGFSILSGLTVFL